MVTDAPPLYQRIAADLRGQIAAGLTVVPGPSELAQRYYCTRPTTYKAIELLRREGLVGEGRRVRRRDPFEIEVAPAETLTWQEAVARAGRETWQEITVAIRDGMLVRTVLRYLDREPHHVAESTFPLEKVQGTRLAYDHDIPEGWVRYLKEGLGWDLELGKPAFEAQNATEADARVLRISPGAAVLMEYWAGSSGGQPVFRARRVLRGDMTRLIGP